MFEYIVYIKEVISNYLKKQYENLKKNKFNNTVVCPPYYAPFRNS